MFRRRLIGSLIIAMTMAVAIGCRKEETPPRWDVDVVTPLAKISLSIKDLVPDSMLATDGDGNVSILHTMELFSLSLDTVLTAPDTSFLYSYALPFPGPLQFPPGSTFDTNDDVTRFDLGALQLTRLVIRSGQVQLAITNMMNGQIVGNFSLPGATLAGLPLNLVMELPPGTPASPATTTDSRPLNGYVLDLRGPGFNATNSMATHLSYSNSANGGSVTITNMDSLLALVSYQGIVPEYALGSFGTQVVELDSGSTELDLFTHVTGTLDLEQVDARIRLVNGLGADARANVNYIRARNNRTGQAVDLSGPITQGLLNIDRALDLGNTFQPTVKTYVLDQGNSNIKQFLENLPDLIEYSLDLTLNPLGNISNGHDFLYHDSQVKAELEVDIPLRLIATDLMLSKDIDFELPGNAEGPAWRSGVLHLFAVNGFPFSADLGLAVVDRDGHVLDVIQPGGTVPSGVLGADGLVVQPNTARLDFEVTAEQAEMIHQTGKLRVTALFNTADQSQHVQIREDYRMDLKLSMDANWLVNGGR